ncbi:hypothetical protein ACTG9Q_14855 [Actinokineospora sp. 24-640]
MTRSKPDSEKHAAAKQAIAARLKTVGHKKVKTVKAEHAKNPSILLPQSLASASDGKAKNGTTAAEAQKQVEFANNFLADAEPVTEMCHRVAERVQEFTEYVFITATGHTQKAIKNAKHLQKETESFEKALQEKIRKPRSDIRKELAAEHQDTSSLNDKAEALRANRAVMAGRVHGLGVAAREAIENLEEAVAFEIQKANVRNNPTMVDKGIQVMSAVIDGASAVGGEFAGPFKPLVTLAGGVKSLLWRQLLAAKSAADVKELRKKGSASDAFDALGADPGLLAVRVAQKYKDDFDTALDLIGSVAGNVEGWTVIRVTLKTAVHTYFDTDVKNAVAQHLAQSKTKEKLRTADDDSYATMLFQTGLEAMSGLPGVVAGALNGAKFNPVDFGFALAQPFLEWIAEKIIDQFDLGGNAQIVTADQLLADFTALRNAHKVVRDGEPDAVEPETPGPPKRDKRNRRVREVMQDSAETDSAGVYWWVRIGDEIGKIHRDRTFTPVSGMELRFPSTIEDGTEIDKVLGPAGSDLPGVGPDSWIVIVGDLEGHVPGDRGKFTPMAPVEFSDWTGRVVKADGYVPKGADKVEGTWHRSAAHDGGRQYFLFEPASGPREWARPEDKTADRGMSVADAFKDNKSIRVTPMTLAP